MPAGVYRTNADEGKRFPVSIAKNVLAIPMGTDLELLRRRRRSQRAAKDENILFS
jgi:hypothetical protein